MPKQDDGKSANRCVQDTVCPRLIPDLTPAHPPSRPALTNTSTAVILTCWHLVFATIATQVLARTTNLLDGRKNVKMTGRNYMLAIVPIGLL